MVVWCDDVVPGFTLPVLLRINGREQRVTVSERPLELDVGAELESFELDRNF